MVVPTAPILNPWLVHLTHLALGQPAGHEILHDAFRLGLLSLASFDIGLKMRKSAQKAGYEAMYKTSSEQRRSALKLLRVANALKLDHEKVGADLVLATVAALAIRDVSRRLMLLRNEKLNGSLTEFHSVWQGHRTSKYR